MVEGVLPEHVRLFIAIAVPEEIKVQVTNAQDELRQNLGRAVVKWTRPEQFHLTLRFLGNIDAQAVEQLISAVRLVCRSVRPLQLSANGLGFFPNPRSPRVLWVGVQDENEQLQSLQETMQQATHSFTDEKAEERFSGHITLARIKQIRRHEIAALTRAAERHSGRAFGEWTAHEVLILRSDLSSQGAEHIVLANAAFS